MLNFPIRIIALTVLVLLGMAANSLLARFALGGHLISALPFTMVRLASGAVMLLGLSLATKTRPVLSHPFMPIMLFVYALGFAYGYQQLGAAMGTLFLFISIQATMLSWEVRNGYKLSTWEWIGIGITLIGLWILVGETAQKPDMFGIALMSIAGIAWAVYSILGTDVTDSLSATTANFLWSGLAAIFLLAVYAIIVGFRSGNFLIAHITLPGLYYTLAIGSITSALVYVLWYILVKELSGIVVAAVQMVVPVIVAISAVPLLDEHLTAHQLVGGSLILLGLSFIVKQQGNRNKT